MINQFNMFIFKNSARSLNILPSIFLASSPLTKWKFKLKSPNNLFPPPPPSLRSLYPLETKMILSYGQKWDFVGMGCF